MDTRLSANLHTAMKILKSGASEFTLPAVPVECVQDLKTLVGEKCMPPACPCSNAHCHLCSVSHLIACPCPPTGQTGGPQVWRYLLARAIISAARVKGLLIADVLPSIQLPDGLPTSVCPCFCATVFVQHFLFNSFCSTVFVQQCLFNSFCATVVGQQFCILSPQHSGVHSNFNVNVNEIFRMACGMGTNVHASDNGYQCDLFLSLCHRFPTDCFALVNEMFRMAALLW